MEQGFRRGFTAAEKTVLWDRWQREFCRNMFEVPFFLGDLLPFFLESPC
jgi:hypothetical protein